MYHQALIDAGAPTPPSDDPALAALLSEAIRSLDAEPPMARCYLERLPNRLVRSDAEVAIAQMLPRLPSQPHGVTKGGLAGWQLRRVTAYVDAHLQGPIFTSTLAEVVHLSTGHFCRAFKASTGETPHGYVVRQRIRRAQLLMRDTQDTLSEIACACGLSDQAHLTRLFRRLVGMTPLAWRRAWRQAG